jgi:hypothetical protein
VTINNRYVRAAKPGVNPYSLMLYYLRQAERIIVRRHAGKRQHPSRYIAKGGIRK